MYHIVLSSFRLQFTLWVNAFLMWLYYSEKNIVNRKVEFSFAQANRLSQTWSFMQAFLNSVKGKGDENCAWDNLSFGWWESEKE